METWGKLLKGITVNERLRCNFFNVAIWFSAVGTVVLHQQQQPRQIRAAKKAVPLNNFSELWDSL